MADPLPLRVASPNEARAEVILLGPEAAAANERLRQLRKHRDATQTVVDDLEEALKQRLAPHQKRKAELRAAIDLLEAMEGEQDDAIIAMEREAAGAIAAAEADAVAADAAYWDAWKANRP